MCARGIFTKVRSILTVAADVNVTYKNVQRSYVLFHFNRTREFVYRGYGAESQLALHQALVEWSGDTAEYALFKFKSQSERRALQKVTVAAGVIL